MRIALCITLVLLVSSTRALDEPEFFSNDGDMMMKVASGKNITIMREGDAASKNLFSIEADIATKATTADVSSLATNTVNTLLQTPTSKLAQTLASKPNQSEVYLKTETYSMAEVDAKLVAPITQFNSPLCLSSNVGARRVHTAFRQTQLCLETDVAGVYGWQGEGCALGCAACAPGSSSTCTHNVATQPDILHMSFENNLFDASGNNYNGLLVGNMSNNLYSTYATDGLYAAKFDGEDDYIVLPTMTIGGAMSACASVQYVSFQSWSRVFDFGNGQQSDNIVLANEANTNNLVFETYVGSVAYRLTAPEFFQTAVGAYVDVCVTVDASGVMSAYRNGRLIVQKTDGQPPNTMQRTRNLVAESNWNNEFFNGYIDNLRMWSRALTGDEIWQATCVDYLGTGTQKLDCSGLLMHLTFDQLSLADRSPSKWQGTLSNPNGNNVWAKNGKIGFAFGLDGEDDHAAFSARTFGGDITICAWVFNTGFKGWARIIDFGAGRGVNNIVLANRQATPTLYFNTDAGGILEVPDFWTPFVNTWGHVCVTVDSSTDLASAYQNGVAMGTPKALTQDTGVTTVERNLNYLGRSNWVENALFFGKIDELRIYEYVLSPEEVTTMQTLGL